MHPYLSFQRHAVGPIPVGEQLKALRRAQGISREMIASRTLLPLDAISALEEGRYADLPGSLYIEQFLGRYARILGLSERLVIAHYRREGQGNARAFPPPPQEVPARSLRGPLPFRPLILLPLLFLALTYLLVSSRHLVFPPSLAVTSPAAYLETDHGTIAVAGRAQQGSHVFLNGEEVPLSPTGTFREDLSLTPGLNTIRIQAVGKSGKTTTTERQVLKRTGGT